MARRDLAWVLSAAVAGYVLATVLLWAGWPMFRAAPPAALLTFAVMAVYRWRRHRG